MTNLLNHTPGHYFIRCIHNGRGIDWKIDGTAKERKEFRRKGRGGDESCAEDKDMKWRIGTKGPAGRKRMTEGYMMSLLLEGVSSYGARVRMTQEQAC